MVGWYSIMNCCTQPQRRWHGSVSEKEFTVVFCHELGYARADFYGRSEILCRTAPIVFSFQIAQGNYFGFQHHLFFVLWLSPDIVNIPPLGMKVWLGIDLTRGFRTYKPI